MERPNGLHGQYGLWGADKDHQSSNYRELRNLVETAEEEAVEGYLKDGEFWLFTNNSTAESCFFRGGSSSKLLHDLVLQLRKAEIHHGFVLHVMGVAGMRMIAQGTNGLQEEPSQREPLWGRICFLLWTCLGRQLKDTPQ